MVVNRFALYVHLEILLLTTLAQVNGLSTMYVTRFVGTISAQTHALNSSNEIFHYWAIAHDQGL